MKYYETITEALDKGEARVKYSGADKAKAIAMRELCNAIDDKNHCTVVYVYDVPEDFCDYDEGTQEEIIGWKIDKGDLEIYE